jgi:RNA-directed DNA polymerase
MSRLQDLKAATSLIELATLLAFKPKAVAYILYKQPADRRYRTFQIPKRNGGLRTIKAPFDRLKLLQRRVSDLLQDCVEEIATERQVKDQTSHGFERHRSIMTNAQRHRHRRWVFNLDLEDFFPSINFGPVRGYFLKNRYFALNQDVATVLAQIACTENSLPQGSPCSPVISNLIAHLLDIRLARIAAQVGCTYSRYADDLTFSTNERRFPAEIAVSTASNPAGPDLWVPGEALRVQIERTGFEINPNKTHLMYNTSRQTVTGLVVNEKVSVPREYRHNARAMVHRLTTTGQFDVVTQRTDQSVLEKRLGTHHELHGMLGFIDSVGGARTVTKTRKPVADRSSGQNVYRKFLFYSTFYAARTPVIICEGDTDNVYLTHAIRSLARDFPSLADVTPGDKIRLTVRLYKYPSSSTARLLDLEAGGNSALAKFIAAYKKETKGFAGPPPTKPILIPV